MIVLNIPKLGVQLEITPFGCVLKGSMLRFACLKNQVTLKQPQSLRHVVSLLSPFEAGPAKRTEWILRERSLYMGVSLFGAHALFE